MQNVINGRHAKFNSQQCATKGTTNERANWTTRFGFQSAFGFDGVPPNHSFDPGPSPGAVPNWRPENVFLGRPISERSFVFARAEKKAPNPVDKHVGGRMRMRRMMLAMSQGKLGDALGLTFQQVQKYEKGTNRIGASRLQHIAHILQVPVAFFFEGAPDASVPRRSHGSALSIAQIDDFVSDSNGLRLIGAFMRIDNAALRRKIVMLVQEIAGDDGN
jgi:transcriptional regulator with XRE-family HTH domain